MNKKQKMYLFWVPVIIGALFILFGQIMYYTSEPYNVSKCYNPGRYQDDICRFEDKRFFLPEIFMPHLLGIILIALPIVIAWTLISAKAEAEGRR